MERNTYFSCRGKVCPWGSKHWGGRYERKEQFFLFIKYRWVALIALIRKRGRGKAYNVREYISDIQKN